VISLQCPPPCRRSCGVNYFLCVILCRPRSRWNSLCPHTVLGYSVNYFFYVKLRTPTASPLDVDCQC